MVQDGFWCIENLQTCIVDSRIDNCLLRSSQLILRLSIFRCDQLLQHVVQLIHHDCLEPIGPFDRDWQCASSQRAALKGDGGHCRFVRIAKYSMRPSRDLRRLTLRGGICGGCHRPPWLR